MSKSKTNPNKEQTTFFVQNINQYSIQELSDMIRDSLNEDCNVFALKDEAVSSMKQDLLSQPTEYSTGYNTDVLEVTVIIKRTTTLTIRKEIFIDQVDH